MAVSRSGFAEAAVAFNFALRRAVRSSTTGPKTLSRSIDLLNLTRLERLERISAVGCDWFWLMLVDFFFLESNFLEQGCGLVWGVIG